ncbi:hypothetical protein GCM10023317_19430 [Actinopolymorpha pittospori]|uniref:Uncharacterized protein n=1 Tax=Actinopolymorpha pittospori TaxID=648752 RepID=A0A927RGK8_9ACTN|nr:hypothetical protein [Actinopolymorpha pittospori]
MHHLGRAEHGERDGQVEVGTRLGQGGGRQRDRQLPLGPPLTRVGDGRPDPGACFGQGRVRESDQAEAGQAVADVGFDVDDMTLDSGEGDRA